jgi:hypothetical protein
MCNIGIKQNLKTHFELLLAWGYVDFDEKTYRAKTK